MALVTSLRDGMNLVSYEYVACQNAKNTEGVLVLSEVSLLLNVYPGDKRYQYRLVLGNANLRLLELMVLNIVVQNGV